MQPTTTQGEHLLLRYSDGDSMTVPVRADSEALHGFRGDALFLVDDPKAQGAVAATWRGRTWRGRTWIVRRVFHNADGVWTVQAW
jgi:hypothetical protein